MQRTQKRQAVALTRSRDLRLALIALLTFFFVALQAVATFARSDSLAPLVERISPSVVNITTSTLVERPMIPPGIVPEGSPFEDLFRDFRDRGGENQPPRRSSALGSGFVISESGFIVTNNHVIEQADEITIEFFDGTERVATLVGTDPLTDIALLKVEADEPLPFVTFGDSDIVRVGDWVLAMGNPLGQGFSASVGIVSARNRALRGTYDDYLQTDAAINRGNSGGPLFNMDGEVVGVNTAILSPDGGSIGIGFSMASNVVTRVIDQLEEFGETRRGWLGVGLQTLDPALAEAMGLDTNRGALIREVFADGPASAAGVKSGDVILSFDGSDVADNRELIRLVGNAEVGKTVRLVVFRDGETVTLRVTLGRREEAQGTANTQAQKEDTPTAPETGEILGLQLSSLTDELRAQLELDAQATGLAVLGVDTQSDAYEKGLRAGDLITEVARNEVTTPEAFDAQIAQALEAGRSSILLLVERDSQPRFLALDISKR